MTAQLIIADDCAEMRWLVRTALREEFPHAIEAEDGRQLFWQLLRSSFAAGPKQPTNLVVIADVFMPGYDGLEVLSAWQDPNHPVPLVVITCFPDEEVRMRAARIGAVLLPKPFSCATLRRVVREAAQTTPRS